LLWQISVVAFDVPVYFVPAPTDVARALFRGRDLYAAHFLVTLSSTLIAFAIAFVLGVLLGTLISEMRFLERTLYPLLIALQSMPRIALAPIIISGSASARPPRSYWAPSLPSSQSSSTPCMA
jgi:NitT/TauT family transport system permease protein